MSKKATVRCPSCGTLNRVDLARAADRPQCGKCKAPIALDRPQMLTDADFDRVVSGSEVPVVVDFYADWCGPCKMMEPVVNDLARARTGSVLFAKLDTDRNPSTTRRFHITSLPTVAVFRGGREVARELGALPRPRLEALVDRAGAAT
jgi:thioredoxin 2